MTPEPLSRRSPVHTGLTLLEGDGSRIRTYEDRWVAWFTARCVQPSFAIPPSRKRTIAELLNTRKRGTLHFDPDRNEDDFMPSVKALEGKPLVFTTTDNKKRQIGVITNVSYDDGDIIVRATVDDEVVKRVLKARSA